MIIIPEIETVVILTPRTGSKALRAAILSTYEDAIPLYRHMEADGVPHGYDRWRRVGVVRHPVARLWSLYRYLRRFGLDYSKHHEPIYTAAMRASVAMPFEDWLLQNERVFTSPFSSANGRDYYPAYSCRHPMPENRKSQFVYLRPDLGTMIFPYMMVLDLYAMLGVEPEHINAAPPAKMPELSDAARDHIERFHSWDLQACFPRAGE